MEKITEKDTNIDKYNFDIKFNCFGNPTKYTFNDNYQLKFRSGKINSIHFK